MLGRPMTAAVATSGRWVRTHPRPPGLAALVAVVSGALAYMILAVPVASAPLPDGHRLLFCPLWAPPVPRSVAVMHWRGALAAAAIVVAIDSLALLRMRLWPRRARTTALRAAARPPAIRLQRVPLRVALIAGLASATLLFAAAMQGYPLWVIALFGLAPWLPVLTLEAAWKYEHYGVWTLFGVIVLLQFGHLGEHTVQVIQIGLTHGQLDRSHGVFGQLDFETVHFVWDSFIWLSLCLLLRPFASGNRWLWVAFAAASLHEVEHVYLFWIYWAHPAFYAAGGFEGIMGNGGVIGSPLARPYLHFAYNFLVIVPMAIAFWDETKRARSAWPAEAPAPSRAKVRLLAGRADPGIARP